MTQDTKPLQDALLWLCGYRGDNNLFGRILNNCKRHYKSMEWAACVTANKSGRYSLYIDLEKFNARPAAQQIVTLIHEAGHLALCHLERAARIISKGRDEGDPRLERYYRLANYAMDMAVNDLIVRPLVNRHKSKALEIAQTQYIYPEMFGLEQGLSFEQYFEILLNNKDKADEVGKTIQDNNIPIAYLSLQDDQEKENEHESPKGTQRNSGKQNSEKGDSDVESAMQTFKDLSPAELERLVLNVQRETGQILKAAVEQQQKAKGNIPDFIKATIEELTTESKIPWNIILRNHIKSIISSKLIPTVNQPNTALYPSLDDGIEPFPGYNHDFTFHIVTASDASGSVSNDEYRTFVTEQIAILRQYQGIYLTQIVFDAAIGFEKTYTKTDTDTDIQRIIEELRVRYGYGGTEFNPPFRRVLGKDTNEDWTKGKPVAPLKRVDLFIVFTDGYACVSTPGPIPNLKPPCPVIWVLTKSGKIDENMQDIAVKIED